MWVWGSIRSDMKAVVDFRSQNVSFFTYFLYETIRNPTLKNSKNRFQVSAAGNGPQDPILVEKSISRAFQRVSWITMQFREYLENMFFLSPGVEFLANIL